MLARHVSLLLLAAENVARNPRGYAVAASGLVAGLALLLCGVAIGEGLKLEALESVKSGANVYCTWDMFGRDAPVPRAKVEELARLDGVVRAVPILLGLGVEELSVSLPAIPSVKAQIRSLRLDACRQLAERALSADSAEEVRELVADQEGATR